MKKIWVKVLSCFMAVNLMFMCLATSVFAGNVRTFRLNGKNDGLDVVLKELTTDDWRSLHDICGIKLTYDPYNTAQSDLVKKFNKEIRSNYGNTITNIGRRLFGSMEYNPGYGKILLDTAKKLDIPVADEITPYDVVNVEKVVVAKVIEKIRDNILKEDGDKKGGKK